MEKVLADSELLNGKTENKRNYGIDLLRIVSMFMIVCLHVLGKGGVIGNAPHFTVKGEIFWAIEIACYCSVNCYALISGYVGINAKHKYTNLISLCLQLVFYAILITGAEIIIAHINGTELSWKTIILHLLPSMKRYWYFSSYFCLFFFMPILNYIVQNAPREILKKLAIFIIIVFCVCNLLISKVSGIMGGYSFLWLAILYVAGGYFAKYKTFEKWSVSKSFIGYFVCIAITVVSKVVLYILSEKVLGEAQYFNILINYNSPTIVLAAVFLLGAFSKMNIGEGLSKIISFASPLTFGIYLIHCHPYMYESLDKKFVWVVNEPIYLGVLYALGGALAIFLICLILDWIRSLLFKLLKIKEFAAWIEKIIGAIIGWICKILRISLNEEKNNEVQEKKTEIAD